MGHGRGVSFDSPPRGVERAAAEMLAALRSGTEFAVSDEVRARFVAFVHGVADMCPSEFSAFQSWLRGETAKDAARRSGVTRQATSQARNKMLRKLRVAE